MQTLRLSKAFEDVFQYSILGAPTGNCIEHLIFDYAGGNDLTSFVCQTCPQLPKLRSFTGLDADFTTEICLTSHQVLSDPSEVAVYLKSQRSRQILLQIASRITVWDVKLDGADAELLLSPNYDGIESLTLASDEDYGFAILESAESKFPFILSNCTKLRNLSVNQTNDHENPVAAPVVDSVLSTTFPFATTLRSLTLDLERYGEPTTSNEFLFPTLFPSLEILKITFRSENLDQIRTKSFILPKLLKLEVVYCPFLYMHVLIESLILPSIRSIQIETADSTEATYDAGLEEMRKLAAELDASASTLELFHLLDDDGLDEEYTTPLVSIKTDAAIFVNSSLIKEPKSTNVRHRGARQSTDPNVDNADDYDMFDLDEPVILGLVDGELTKEVVKNGSGSTEGLMEWARGRIMRCQDIDEAGVDEMRRVLEPVKKLREWLED